MIKIEIENDCVGCPMGCIECGRKHSPHPFYICDECDEEVEELYEDEDDGTQLCMECALKRFNRIDNNNWSKFTY